MRLRRYIATGCRRLGRGLNRWFSLVVWSTVGSVSLVVSADCGLCATDCYGVRWLVGCGFVSLVVPAGFGDEALPVGSE